MGILSAGSPRFPGRGQSYQGESVPKARPRGVVDGNQVNIPEPNVWSDAGVEKDSRSRARVFLFKVVGSRCREIASMLIREPST